MEVLVSPSYRDQTLSEKKKKEERTNERKKSERQKERERGHEGARASLFSPHL
ncbi:hypothetical protein ACRRTK_005500 [Alexandromys fortis]